MKYPQPVLAPEYDSPFDVPRIKVLKGRSRKIMQSVIDAMLPRNEKIDLPLEKEVFYFTENFLAYLPAMLRRAFPLGLWLLEVFAVLEGGERRTFSRMQDRQKQFAYLQKWNRSSLFLRRELMKGIRAIVMCGFYSHDQVWDVLEYKPKPFLEQKIIEREQKYGSELERPTI